MRIPRLNYGLTPEETERWLLVFMLLGGIGGFAIGVSL